MYEKDSDKCLDALVKVGACALQQSPKHPGGECACARWRPHRQPVASPLAPSLASAQMGVLVPGGDRTAVKRTADFFLTQFTERLEAQVGFDPVSASWIHWFRGKHGTGGRLGGR